MVFIEQLPVVPSHYGRGDSGRQYLSSDLNIMKLWRSWKAGRIKENLPVTSSAKFDNVFRTNFNLSFRQPRVDVCSTCQDFDIKINSNVDREENEAARALHLARAKKFYQILKNSVDLSDVISVTFDMQKNQALPKTNVCEAYYARQLWLYNLTIVIHSKKQARRNVHIYSWLESDSGKGSNEVVSVLNHFFENVLQNRIKCFRIRKIMLFSDSCPAQNKNGTMLAFLQMKCQALKKYVREIAFYFPIKGHSYLPPDRVFGRIEKEIKKKPVIKSPAEYHEIFQKYGKVYIFGDDFFMYDYKLLSEQVLVKNRSKMQMAKNKIWKFKRSHPGIVFVSNSYADDFHEFNVMKKSVKGINTRKPRLLRTQSHVSLAKKADVEKLLKFVPLTDAEKKFYADELKKKCVVKDTAKRAKLVGE